MRAIDDWKQEKQAGCVADALRVEARRPAPLQRRREQALSTDAGEVCSEGGFKTRDEGGEIRQCISSSANQRHRRAAAERRWIRR